MTIILEIREIVNSNVPGVGKGVVDYAIKSLGISNESSNPEDINKCVKEVVKHIQTLYGIDKANLVKSKLENL